MKLRTQELENETFQFSGVGLGRADRQRRSSAGPCHVGPARAGRPWAPAPRCGRGRRQASRRQAVLSRHYLFGAGAIQSDTYFPLCGSLHTSTVATTTSVKLERGKFKDLKLR